MPRGFLRCPFLFHYTSLSVSLQRASQRVQYVRRIVVRIRICVGATGFCFFQIHLNVSWATSYNRIMSTKSPLFCTTTFSARLHLVVLLPQSCDCSYYASRLILAPPPLGSQQHDGLRAHDLAHFPDLRDISLGSLRSPAPEAGDFVELLLLLYRAD